MHVQNQFLSGLATCDPDFPVTEWDRLIPQAEMKLNHLRASRCNPKLSAYTYIHGLYDFNKVPLAPPCTTVILHKKTGPRLSWGYRGKQAWYVGPAHNHYQCFRCYVPETNQEVVVDTLTFIPQKIPLPTYDINMQLQDSIDKTVTILSATLSNIHPSSHLIKNDV